MISSSALPYRFISVAALLSALAVMVFLPGLGGDFIFDDKPNIVTNASLHVAELSLDSLLYATYSFQPGGGSRSLAMLTFAVDYWRAGLDPAAFKITNLLIHGLTTFALAFFFRTLLALAQWPPRRAAVGALILALVWAVHPLQVSSVLYVVQRMQTMGTLFLVLALLGYLRARQSQLDGDRSRGYWVLAGLGWALALACKEDSVLLPAFAWVLELTVLRFRSADPRVARRLRLVYTFSAILGTLLFLFVVVPHYWHWEAYPGRDFSSQERLLTQGRVLFMYLGQILLPLPSNMPFYYDDVVVSRGWLEPLSTASSLLVLLALLAVAYFWRNRRPLFTCGVLLFFVGHFISSNVIPLELAFEHRNHFPLIGIVLAVGDLCAAIWQYGRIRLHYLVVMLTAAFLFLGGMTVSRAYAWGEPLRFAERAVEIAPGSPRAWLELCTSYFDLNELNVDGPYLDLAIETCQKGAEKTGSPSLLSNVVIFKTIKGSVTDSDWQRFLTRLREERLSEQNRGIVWVTLDNVDRNIPLDEKGVMDTIEISASKTTWSPAEYLRVATYIFNETHEPIKAFAYMQRAVELSEPEDPAVQGLLQQLSGAGLHDWVDRLKSVQRVAQEQKNI